MNKHTIIEFTVRKQARNIKLILRLNFALWRILMLNPTCGIPIAVNSRQNSNLTLTGRIKEKEPPDFKFEQLNFREDAKNEKLNALARQVCLST